MNAVEWLTCQDKCNYVTVNEAGQILPAQNHFAEIACRFNKMEKVLAATPIVIESLLEGREIPQASTKLLEMIDWALTAARAPIEKEKTDE